jgi:phage terminase Nu1 subunit (DNA packaging protein)
MTNKKKIKQGAPFKASEAREPQLFGKKDFKEQYPDWIVTTHEQVAKVLGVTTRMVQYWAKDGMPVTEKGQYNLLDIQAWRSQGKSKKETEESQATNKWDVEFREAKARLARIDYEKKIGNLLDKKVVEAQWVEIAEVFKQELVSFPNKVAPQLVGKDVLKIQGILTARVDEVMNNLNALAGQDDFITGEQEKNVTKEKKA